MRFIDGHLNEHSKAPHACMSARMHVQACMRKHSAREFNVPEVRRLGLHCQCVRRALLSLRGAGWLMVAAQEELLVSGVGSSARQSHERLSEAASCAASASYSEEFCSFRASCPCWS